MTVEAQLTGHKRHKHLQTGTRAQGCPPVARGSITTTDHSLLQSFSVSGWRDQSTDRLSALKDEQSGGRKEGGEESLLVAHTTGSNVHGKCFDRMGPGT